LKTGVLEWSGLNPQPPLLASASGQGFRRRAGARRQASSTTLKPLAGKALLSLNLKVADTSPKAGVYPGAVPL
jgi:hypothetical protein